MEGWYFSFSQMVYITKPNVFLGQFCDIAKMAIIQKKLAKFGYTL
jgi:hypothetical protein